jgi:hypothetical protein
MSNSAREVEDSLPEARDSLLGAKGLALISVALKRRWDYQLFANSRPNTVADFAKQTGFKAYIFEVPSVIF